MKAGLNKTKEEEEKGRKNEKEKERTKERKTERLKRLPI